MLHSSHNLTWVICLHTVCSIWPIDMTLSDATTPDQSGPGSNGNEWVLCIPQISKTGASPLDCLMPYLGHSLGESYPSAEMQLVYSTASAVWANIWGECNGYHCGKWIWWLKFKCWTRLFAFYIALIDWKIVWVQLFSLKLEVD